MPDKPEPTPPDKRAITRPYIRAARPWSADEPAGRLGPRRSQAASGDRTANRKIAPRHVRR